VLVLRYRLILLTVILPVGLAGLVGCGAVPRADRPATVESRGSEVPPPPPEPTGGRTQISAYTPPAAPSYARPAPARAVKVLQQRADDQQRAGDYANASASLERALRIAPDDPALWHQLAGVRLEEGRYAMVTELAAKSNSLADPADRALRRANWSLIAEARKALGDSAGAREARRFAASP
jgi:tetratricopeptide (TPR) repeat protein